MNNKIKSNMALLGTAIIWGGAFVAQRSGMDSMGPFMYSFFRMLFAILALLPLMLITEKRNKKKEVEIDKPKDVLIGGICVGIVYFIAANLQQIGLIYVDAGKTAFITALYILLVPIIGLFLKKKITRLNWVGAVVGVVGLYFLCIKDGFAIAGGDFIVLVGSLFWAIHILLFDYFTVRISAAKLVIMQSMVTAVLSLAVALFTEDISFGGFVDAIPTLIYSGALSAGVAFTLQAIGQKHANPITASIILSTESVFGAICGFIFLHEIMSGREFIGCGLMLVAIVVSQLPSKPLSLKK